MSVLKETRHAVVEPARDARTVINRWQQ